MSDQTDFVFAGDSDISAEDQREVLTAIERVSQENRITASPEVFRYRPTRKGFLLPMLVNLAAILALVLGIVASSFIGRRDERRLSEGTGVLRSAEGRVIQELRRELEDRLQEKDREISQVQQRLESIRGERDRLASTMEEKIAQRERELRAALEAELAAERARLQAAGESQERIAALLLKMEQVRTTENQALLASYRKQLEAERLALETNLGKLQGEFEGRLNELNRERVSLISDYSQKEEGLRQELEQQRTQLSRQEQQAREQLELLKAQEEKEDFMESQILGFYSAVQKAVVAGDLNDALARLGALERFLDDPQLRSLPEVQARLPIDRFLIDELAGRIRDEVRQSTAQTSELLDSAELLARLRDSASAAQQAAAAGEREAARQRYRAALALMPELLTGLELIIRMEQEEATVERRKLEQRLAAAITERRELEQRLELAEAVAERRELEQRLGVSRAPEPAAAAPPPEPVSTQPQDVPEAARILESAQALVQRGDHRAAIEEYLRLLRSYPLSRQAGSALEGVRRAASLQETRRQGELQELRRQLQQFESRQGALREELEKLRPLAERQTSLAAGYAGYAQREGSLEVRATPTALFQTKQYLDEFLASEPVRQVFPGFLERIHRYDAAFEQGGLEEGREEAVSELIDLVYDLSSYETNQERLQYLQKEIERQRGNQSLRVFLEELSTLLKS